MYQHPSGRGTRYLVFNHKSLLFILTSNWVKFYSKQNSKQKNQTNKQIAVSESCIQPWGRRVYNLCALFPLVLQHFPWQEVSSSADSARLAWPRWTHSLPPHTACPWAPREKAFVLGWEVRCCLASHCPQVSNEWGVEVERAQLCPLDEGKVTS